MSCSISRESKTRGSPLPCSRICEANALMRRCFARVLLLINLVGEESPRCLTPSADRAKPFLVEQAAEPMGYLNYPESACFNINRLFEGAERMSLPIKASEQRKRVITSAPWAQLLA